MKFFVGEDVEQQSIFKSHATKGVSNQAAPQNKHFLNPGFHLTLPCNNSGSSSMPDLSVKASRIKVADSTGTLQSDQNLAVSSSNVSSGRCKLNNSGDLPAPEMSDVLILLDDSVLLHPSTRLLQLSEASLDSVKNSSLSGEGFSPNLFSKTHGKLQRSKSSSPNVKRHYFGLPGFLSRNSSLRSVEKRNSNSSFSSLLDEANLKHQTTCPKSSSSISNFSCLLKSSICGKFSSTEVEPSFYRTRSLKVKKKAWDASIGASSKSKLHYHHHCHSAFFFFDFLTASTNLRIIC